MKRNPLREISSRRHIANILSYKGLDPHRVVVPRLQHPGLGGHGIQPCARGRVGCDIHTHIPTPMPKVVCITHLYNILIQQEVCITCLGRGMGMNITARERSEGVTASRGRRSVTHLFKLRVSKSHIQTHSKSIVGHHCSQNRRPKAARRCMRWLVRLVFCCLMHEMACPAADCLYTAAGGQSVYVVFQGSWIRRSSYLQYFVVFLFELRGRLGLDFSRPFRPCPFSSNPRT